MGNLLGKYRDYTTRLSRREEEHVTYEELVGGGFGRIFAAIERVPSRKEFILTHYEGATAAERAAAEAYLEALPFKPASEFVPGWFRSTYADSGIVYFSSRLARPIDINGVLDSLELELLLDPGLWDALREHGSVLRGGER